MEDLQVAYGARPELTGSQLNGLDFAGDQENLTNTDLSYVDLRLANFSGAVLSSANLRGENTADANFRGVTYDKYTVFS